MAQIKVNTGGMSELGVKLGRAAARCGDCSSIVSVVCAGLDWKIQAENDIDGRIRSINRRIQRQQDKAQDYKRCVSEISQQFMRTDRSLQNEMKRLRYRTVGRGVIAAVLGNLSGGSKKHCLLDFMDSVYSGQLDILESLGELGGEIWTGIGTAGGFVAGAYGVAKSGAAFVKKRYGEGIKYAAEGAKSFLEAKKGFTTLAKGALKTGAGAVQTAGSAAAKSVKSAGSVLTVVANAGDNYQEYKDGEITGERAVQETIVESAIDIGLVAGAAALTVVCPAAPVIYAVGKAALDVGLELAGKESSTEIISDFLLDACGGSSSKGTAAPWKKYFRF